jgi:hypothetical protein
VHPRLDYRLLGDLMCQCTVNCVLSRHDGCNCRMSDIGSRELCLTKNEFEFIFFFFHYLYSLASLLLHQAPKVRSRESGYNNSCRTQSFDTRHWRDNTVLHRNAQPQNLTRGPSRLSIHTYIWLCWLRTSQNSLSKQDTDSEI